MAQQAVLVFETVTDPEVEPARPTMTEALARIARSSPDDAGMAAPRISEEDTAYFQARAEAEAIRAEEAAHPAARGAHLEMAALYRLRALTGRQLEEPADPDWMSEDGSLYLDA